VADRYDSMTTAQLEEDAAGRTPPVDLAGITRNADRATRLRLDDQERLQAAAEAAAAAEAELTEPEPEPEEDAAEQPELDALVGGPRASPAPFPSDEDLTQRLGNATPGADPPVLRQPEGAVPAVGGQQGG
jgi:hypothetical protein